MVTSEVRVTVDGHELTTAFAADGEQVTENNVLTRMSHASETLRHMHFVFASTEDHVKIHLLQKQEEQAKVKEEQALLRQKIG